MPDEKSNNGERGPEDDQFNLAFETFREDLVEMRPEFKDQMDQRVQGWIDGKALEPFDQATPWEEDEMPEPLATKPGIFRRFGQRILGIMKRS